MPCPYFENRSPFRGNSIMLKEGDPAPDFRLPADDGSEISLEDLRGKHVALYFYPKASTPGCTTEAIEFRDLKKDFDKLNAVILGCSADSVAALSNFKTKQKLNFPLLAIRISKRSKRMTRDG